MTKNEKVHTPGTGVRGHIPEILLACALLAGIGIMLYPAVSDWWNELHQSQAIATYVQAVNSNSAERNKQLWDEAVAYNERLPHDNGRFKLTDSETQEYESILDVTGTGIMGYVEIPKINTRLAIYHGTNAEVLQVGVGHIPGSSFPVGGQGTHAVFSGHRGLPNARLFTDIDQLNEGDVFILNVLDQTLTYQVDQIRVVLPDQLDDLAIESDKDYCTLVTCTPYGVNSHRLLVRGHRIPNQGLLATDGELVQVNPVLTAAVVTAMVFVILCAVRFIRDRLSNRRVRVWLEGKDRN